VHQDNDFNGLGHHYLKTASAMQDEAAITVNGTRLTDSESRVIRLAMASFADILANEIVLKKDGIALTDQYRTDVALVRALIDGRAQRSQ
jgi:hypothetical protein